MRTPDVPKQAGERSVVLGHPLADELTQLLRERYSPSSIVSLLRWRFSDDFEAGRLQALPSVRTIERFRADHIPPSDLLPKRLLEEKLRDFNTAVDVLRSLELAFVLAENELASQPSAERYATFLAVARALWSCGQDAGLFPSRPSPSARVTVAVTAPRRWDGSPYPDAAEEDLTDERIEVVLGALYSFRTGKSPPQLGQRAPRLVNGRYEDVDGVDDDGRVDIRKG